MNGPPTVDEQLNYHIFNCKSNKYANSIIEYQTNSYNNHRYKAFSVRKQKY